VSGMRLLKAGFILSHEARHQMSRTGANMAETIAKRELCYKLAEEMLKEPGFISEENDYFRHFTRYTSSIYAFEAIRLHMLLRDTWGRGAAGLPFEDICAWMEQKLEQEKEAAKPKGPSQEDAKRLLEEITKETT